ncbi:putative tRNA amidotransferase [Anaplasma centrale str. Israel]|uniref:Aspartyl/glutamyl-tRNA(Asn/Gln) amidotransferase subunit C n=1 Tax=Anaplasma centrale (strain Israel) TaxID=574556 RepID=D1ATU8_ANACI|nr:Asp-tRNA(Asn)/Glu-tRNA(Gln) amidotransferase subunit GatC [Anaplasma centrale]ACZ48976.1 putative tRNA amidotransferase [Anaplasma centrale str. Israel]
MKKSSDRAAVCVGREELARTARLVRLRISEHEIDRYCEELGSVVAWFNMLSEVDTTGVDPVLHGGAPGPLQTRHDTVDDGGMRDQVLACSEVGTEAGCFFVKKVIE